MIIDSVLEGIGNTPLVRLKKISSGNVFVKAEFLNPGGSIKDRVAKHIIETAEKEGKLKPGMAIIEACHESFLQANTSDTDCRIDHSDPVAGFIGWSRTNQSNVSCGIGCLCPVLATARRRCRVRPDVSFPGTIIFDGTANRWTGHHAGSRISGHQTSSD